MRTPRLTCVSEGNPLRRLLIGSKKLFVEIVRKHGTPSFRGSRRGSECPCQELNLIFELRGLACESGTLQGHVVFVESTSPRS